MIVTENIEARGPLSEFYVYANEKIASGTSSWAKLRDEYNARFTPSISRSALRHRCQRFVKKDPCEMGEPVNVAIEREPGTLPICTSVPKTSIQEQSFFKKNNDGSVEEKRFVSVSKDVIDDPNKLLAFLGYDAMKWTLVSYRSSSWQVGSDGKILCAIQYKVAPKTTISFDDAIELALEAFKERIEPVDYTKYITQQNQFKKGLNKDRLMEISPIELHLGKISQEIETGDNYNMNIAIERFEYVFEQICKKQTEERCGKCVLVIGGDFFNSENDGCTSINRVPQQNDMRPILMFREGIRLYTKVILTLREMFDSVDVMLCAGNHARDMETFLYMALEQRFMNDPDGIVKFVNNYKLTQAYTFGKCAIFYNHGEVKLQDISRSIPAEFPEVWGTHPYRELHLGHLHKEVTVDDNGGMIVRRIGSPCGTDAWHYSNRYIGAIKKHEIFIWDANTGLKQLYYIPNKNEA